MVLTASPPKPDQSEAADRLIRVNILNSVPTTVADTVEFGYDGLDRRTRIVEKHGSNILTAKSFLWTGMNISEERSDTGNQVTKRYYSLGYQGINGSVLTNNYYSKDNLGSIYGVTGSDGALNAKYDYNLWGRRAKQSGVGQSDFGFAGYYYQDGKNVILDDSASGASPTLVTNAVTVNPASMTVNVTNKSYTISGSAIAGSGSLTKNGLGTLTLDGTNTYTGNTTINAGELIAATGGSCSKTSSPAPASFPACSAAISAASSMIGPRAVLMITAVGFICGRAAAPMAWSVSPLCGAWTER